MRSPYWIIALSLLTVGTTANAAPVKGARRLPNPHSALRTPHSPDRLEVHPLSVKLESRRAYRQLVVTGYFRGEARDLTRAAEYRVADRRVAMVAGGRVAA